LPSSVRSFFRPLSISVCSATGSIGRRSKNRGQRAVGLPGQDQSGPEKVSRRDNKRRTCRLPDALPSGNLPGTLLFWECKVAGGDVNTVLRLSRLLFDGRGQQGCQGARHATSRSGRFGIVRDPLPMARSASTVGSRCWRCTPSHDQGHLIGRGQPAG
jgi:hypothetical protein